MCSCTGFLCDNRVSTRFSHRKPVHDDIFSNRSSVSSHAYITVGSGSYHVSRVPVFMHTRRMSRTLGMRLDHPLPCVHSRVYCTEQKGVLAPCITLTMKNSLSSLHFDSWGYPSYVNGQKSTQKEGPQHRFLRSVRRYTQMIQTQDDHHDGQSMDPFESRMLCTQPYQGECLQVPQIQRNNLAATRKPNLLSYYI